MSQEHEAVKVLNSDGGPYVKQASIVVKNEINPKLGTTLALTLAQFSLSPGNGTWDSPEPSPGYEISYGENPGQWSASNTTYPAGVKGTMVFLVQKQVKLTLEFRSELNGYGATINGSSSTTINGISFVLKTELNPTNSQPIFTVTALQKK